MLFEKGKCFYRMLSAGLDGVLLLAKSSSLSVDSPFCLLIQARSGLYRGSRMCLNVKIFMKTIHGEFKN